MSSKSILASFIIALAALCVFSAAPAHAAAQAPSAPAATPGKAAKHVPRRPVTVTSDTMEAVTGENLVVFSGNVVAVEDFTLCSDKLTVRYGQDRDVSSIEAAGNVRIFDGDKTSTAGKAVYDRTARTLVLTGSPQVKQCTDVVRGDKITVYLDKDNAVVESNQGGRVRAVIMPDKGCEKPSANGKAPSEEALCKGSR